MLAGETRDTDAMIELYLELIREFDVITIEDPLDEEDFEGFARLTAESGIQIVGDDLFVTNPERLRAGIEVGAANALLWKVNQIGTLSEALDAAELAHRSAYKVVVSERSGETEDPIIADLAVALGAGQIKTGAPVRGERTAKYNRLIRIAEELGATAVYPGASSRRRRSPRSPDAICGRRRSIPAAAPPRSGAADRAARVARRPGPERARGAARCGSPRPASRPATSTAPRIASSRFDGRRADRRRRPPPPRSRRAPARARRRQGVAGDREPRSRRSSATGIAAARSPSAPATSASSTGSRCSAPTTRCRARRSASAARAGCSSSPTGAGEHDLVLACFTGGSSALASLPPDGVTAAEKRALHELLLASGIGIVEVNTVRKHVSAFKGGRLAQRRCRRG